MSNLIPFFPAIYLSVVAVTSAVSPSLERLALLVVVSGLGAGLGKVIVFLFSSMMGKRFLKSSKRESLEELLRATSIGVFLVVLVFAALPLPDDVLYIPLGVAGYSMALFATAVVIGKIILTGLVALLGSGLIRVLKFLSEVSATTRTNNLLSVVIVAAVIVVTGLILAVILYVDWTRVAEALAVRGWRNALHVFLRELARLFKRG